MNRRLEDCVKELMLDLDKAAAMAAAMVAEWGQFPGRIDRNRSLTWAVLAGACASEIQSATMRDNPYSRGSDWRWAWATGFDLGRRIGDAHATANGIADHCRSCIGDWRDEADRLEAEAKNLFGPIFTQHRGMYETLRKCADQLEGMDAG